MLPPKLPITIKQRRTEVFGYFESLGYTYEGELKNIDYWSGTIAIPLSKFSLFLKILIGIDDWDFTTLPHLYLKKPLPNTIQKHVPLAHLQILAIEIFDKFYYSFCYSLPDRNELPRLNPTLIIAYIFSQTISVLKELIENPKARQSELYREIEPTWLLICEYQNSRISSKKNLINRPIRVEFTKEKISFAVYQTQEKQLPFFLINIDNINIPPIINLLPLPNLKGNWHSLFSWLNKWHKGIGEKLIISVKEHIRHISEAKRFGIAIICNHAVLPMYIENIDVPSLFVRQVRNNKDNQRLKNTQLIFSRPGIYISENMLYQRNLENLKQPDLSNKKVLLIGCGAIGGYLGLSLTKIGAGADKNGKLTLIDSDIMGVHNTGRHLLGQDLIGLPKSKALEITLKLQYPNINIDSIAISVFADQINLDQCIIEYDL